ncbi:MAG: hypothetical protein K6F77_08785 [Lachnospiraceae bacterium]|nr:hypothetical protein [Lachnospiraceae bacterium]
MKNRKGKETKDIFINSTKEDGCVFFSNDRNRKEFSELPNNSISEEIKNALNDPDNNIIKKLDTIIEKIDEINNNNKTEIENNELDSIKEELKSTKDELKSTKDELESTKEELKKVNEIYTDRYMLLNSTYDCFQSLSLEMKERLKNISDGNNICLFIVSLTNWNNIEQLWDFTKKRIIEGDMKGVNELVDFFYKAFEVFSEANNNYKLIEPVLNESFDSDKHSIRGNKTDGVVEKVLLAGIYNVADSKIINKALIEV